MNILYTSLKILSIAILIGNFTFAHNADNRNNINWQSKSKDLFVVSNAMYDFIIKLDNHELTQYSNVYNIKKGFSGIIDRNSLESIVKESRITKQTAAGGSTNTAIGFASFGGITTFNSVVSLDNIGHKFYDSILKHGVTPLINFRDQAKTGVVIVFVTPDGERTMFSSQGINVGFNEQDLNYNLVKEYKMLLVDAYSLLDKNFHIPFINLIKEAKLQDTHVAFSLSANYVATRHRDLIKSMLPDINILFGSKYEIMALFDSSDFEQAIIDFRKIGNVGVFTMGEEGAIIINKNDVIMIPSEKNTNVVDVTGAGDMFAAGFLYCYSKNLDLKTCGELGSKAASYIIQQEGVHPQKKLSSMFNINKLLK